MQLVRLQGEWQAREAELMVKVKMAESMKSELDQVMSLLRYSHDDAAYCVYASSHVVCKCESVSVHTFACVLCALVRVIVIRAKPLLCKES